MLCRISNDKLKTSKGVLMNFLEFLGLMFIVVIAFNFLVGIWAVVTASQSKEDMEVSSNQLV
jgi:hypothetical protein